MVKDKAKVPWWYQVLLVISVFIGIDGIIIPVVGIIVSYFFTRKTNKELSSKLIKWSMITIIILLVFRIIIAGGLAYWSSTFVSQRLPNP